MEIYLAGENGKTRILAESIWGGQNDEYLLGRGASREERQTLLRGGQKILETYYTARSNPWVEKLIPYLGGFMLDSGAFSFMFGAKQVDWKAYINGYADYVIQHEVKLFFELDIDSIIGLEKVEELRDRLHQRVGRPSIPVWHISRGKEYFLKMCEEYDYVAFGGLMSDGVSRQKLEKFFPWFINAAHQRGAKIHGLGYTSIEGLHKYHFDSVDSTAWLYGNRGGYLYKFNPRRGDMDKIGVPPGHRLKPREAAEWNFKEWVKFQQYAEKFL